MSALSTAEWFALIAERDFIQWRLEEMNRDIQRPRAPVDALIDAAVGRDQLLLDEAKALIARASEIDVLLDQDAAQ